MDSWNVLIADDEIIIREGIRDAINWSELQLTVVAEAEDGEEALELALEHQVDILLADLNMPIMNGLTLIKQLRTALPHCKVIIITGHDEFVYAQEAIRLSVVDYIIKPVDADQLYEVLKKVCLELTEGQNQTFTAKQLEKNITLLREQFCSNWVIGGLTNEELAEQLSFLQLPDTSPSFIGVIRCPELQPAQSFMSDLEGQELFRTFEKEVARFLKDSSFVKASNQVEGCIYFILWGEVEEELFIQLEQKVQETLQLMIVQSYERLTGELCDLPRSFQRCKEKVYNLVEVSQIVKRAEQYMNAHFYQSSLSLETVADSLQVSSAYLSRLFKEQLGITFTHALTKLRIKRAIQLLHSTNLTINEISEKVGYETQHYFSTAFKKVMGVSPNRYRKGKVVSQQK
ncbi:response regulator [Halalkalibacterium halodurans]|uniref:response regulator transcription factor n=1 Tax=Halalkalibacterium halodurans TaxID=86665 RepID=UPI002E1C7429|nr:response regulator [Halalkalibacterium halodurans]MED4080132.1 response regulator [Halalkalibacterium halodurans]MED4083355.1 response regulator [Halalkalibacterium halodurans]MED4105097.1 response regulator [Halalkalibacterium halodurans]MED4109415.1 response regulator [Halalkalibacterium halodurans]MED4124223.1 response regulator [Halalkalibacterium halodurans]